MIQVWTSREWFGHQVSTISVKVGGLQPASFASVNILLSITTFLGNSLILVALHKESALHAPSKLLYRCLATTDLLVGLIAQPLYVTCWMSVVHEHWTLCYYTESAVYIRLSIMWSFFVDDGGIEVQFVAYVSLGCLWVLRILFPPFPSDYLLSRSSTFFFLLSRFQSFV